MLVPHGDRVVCGLLPVYLDAPLRALAQLSDQHVFDHARIDEGAAHLDGVVHAPDKGRNLGPARRITFCGHRYREIPRSVSKQYRAFAVGRAQRDFTDLTGRNGFIHVGMKQFHHKVLGVDVQSTAKRLRRRCERQDRSAGFGRPIQLLPVKATPKCPRGTPLQRRARALAAEQAHPEVEPPQVISGTGSRFGEHTHVGGGGRDQRDRQLPKPFDDLSCSRRPARYGGGTAGMRQLIEGRGPDPEPPSVRVQQDVGVPDADAFRHPAVLVPDRLPVSFRETDQQARTGGAGCC